MPMKPAYSGPSPVKPRPVILSGGIAIKGDMMRKVGGKTLTVKSPPPGGIVTGHVGGGGLKHYARIGGTGRPAVGNASFGYKTPTSTKSANSEEFRVHGRRTPSSSSDTRYPTASINPKPSLNSKRSSSKKYRRTESTPIRSVAKFSRRGASKKYAPPLRAVKGPAVAVAANNLARPTPAPKLAPKPKGIVGQRHGSFGGSKKVKSGPKVRYSRDGKVGKVMREFKRGELHSGSKKGPTVSSRRQAIAIGLSEARKAGEHVKPRK